MKRESEKKVRRQRRKMHIRKKIKGEPDRPRLTVFKSNKRLYVQAIDDRAGHTISSASNLEKEYRDLGSKIDGAQKIGKLIAERLLEKKIKQVIFDRNGYKYHGKVKALADGARSAGLVF